MKNFSDKFSHFNDKKKFSTQAQQELHHVGGDQGIPGSILKSMGGDRTENDAQGRSNFLKWTEILLKVFEIAEIEFVGVFNSTCSTPKDTRSILNCSTAQRHTTKSYKTEFRWFLIFSRTSLQHTSRFLKLLQV